MARCTLAIYGFRQIVLVVNIPLDSLSGHIKAVSHWIQSGSKGQIKADLLLAKWMFSDSFKVNSLKLREKKIF